MKPTSLNEPLWDAVEACLDARTDPRAQHEVAAALARNPQAREAVEELMQKLELVAAMPAPSGASSGAPNRASTGPEGRHGVPRSTAWLSAGPGPLSLALHAAAGLIAVSVVALGALLGRGAFEPGSPRELGSLGDLPATPQLEVSLTVETQTASVPDPRSVPVGSERIVTWTLESR